MLRLGVAAIDKFLLLIIAIVVVARIAVDSGWLLESKGDMSGRHNKTCGPLLNCFGSGFVISTTCTVEFSVFTRSRSTGNTKKSHGLCGIFLMTNFPSPTNIQPENRIFFLNSGLLRLTSFDSLHLNQDFQKTPLVSIKKHQVLLACILYLKRCSFPALVRPRAVSVYLRTPSRSTALSFSLQYTLLS
ncbi:hypothetical protein EI94DRAFT_121364 [Lactarius quietus]|nr:hypothetical protein EI94DRAFT_121364 [Lactarius quietus]